MDPQPLNGGAFGDAEPVWYPMELNARGAEKRRRPGRIFNSDEVANRLARIDNPITDVLFFVHGFGKDAEGALDFHKQWIEALFAQRAREERAPRRPWRPLLIGLCWPSDPSAPPTVTEFFTGKGPQYHLFGRFEERASLYGAAFGKRLLLRLHEEESMRNTAAASLGLPLPPPVQYHAMGHSLGCHFLSAAVQAASVGRFCSTPLLSTLVLVQGAMPSTDFTPAGRYDKVRDWVSGAILVTHTDTDGALKRYESHHSGKVRALGSEGARMDLCARVHPPLRMGNEHADYAGALQAGKVANVDASAYIRTTGTAKVNLVGGHSNFRGPEVQHLIWAAVGVAEPPQPAAIA